ncbi:MAG: tRNA (adenosine(37)-N6)-threonylcarbamoyltransferase complex transferase subunit TsaD, partial [Planctomycetota bacterium]
MYILAIETTCDETAAAVIGDDEVILSSVVASQEDLHRVYGGVVPEIASRAHLEKIMPVIDEAVRRAGIRLQDLD